MNRNAILAAGALAFAILALSGGAWLGAAAIAPAILCAGAIAIVLSVAAMLARPGRERQLDALERLAEQGRALPEAADALASAVERLRHLESSLSTAHEESIRANREAMAESAEQTSAAFETAVAEAQRTFERRSDASHAAAEKEREETSRVLRHTADRIREDMEKGVAAAAKASQEAVAPVAAEAMQRATEAATEHLAAIRETIEVDDAERRRVQAVAVETLDAHLRTVAERLNAQLEHRADADAKLLIALEAHARQIRETEDARAAEMAGRWERMSEKMETLENERASRLTTLAEATASRGAEVTSEIESLSAAVRDALARVAEADAARAERLGELGEQVKADIGATVSIVRERLEANAEAEAQRTERSAELIETVAATGTAITQSTAAQVAALEAFARAADTRVGEAEDRGAERIADLALRFESAAEAQHKRLQVFESELAERQRAGVESLAAHLADHAQGIDATLRETAELVKEAASLVHAGGGEMTAVAEMFAGAVDKQREAANTWIESLGKIDQAVVDAGEHAAVDVLGNYLARTHELFDQQLGFQQELFEQLTVGADKADPASAPA